MFVDPARHHNGQLVVQVSQAHSEWRRVRRHAGARCVFPFSQALGRKDGSFLVAGLPLTDRAPYFCGKHARYKSYGPRLRILIKERS